MGFLHSWFLEIFKFGKVEDLKCIFHGFGNQKYNYKKYLRKKRIEIAKKKIKKKEENGQIEKAKQQNYKKKKWKQILILQIKQATIVSLVYLQGQYREFDVDQRYNKSQKEDHRVASQHWEDLLSPEEVGK